MRVVFHIGVHKTATSHLQRCLRRAQDRLSAQGVRYVGPADLRGPGQGLPARFGFGKRPAPDLDRVAALADLAQGADRLLLSEENYIGPLLHPVGTTAEDRYVAAGDRVAELAAAMGRDLDVAVSIRNPLGFLNAAYSQSLIAGQVAPVQVFQKRNPIGGVNWVKLVQRLRAANGVGRVTVWRYEDYAAVFPALLEHLVGVEAAKDVPWVDRQVNASLSDCAVAAVMDEGSSALVARDTWPVGPDAAAFDGYHPDQHAMADQAYAAAWAAIRGMDSVTTLQT